MNKNWKRVGMTAAVLAMSALMVFAGAAFAQGNGPGISAGQAAGQVNQYGSGTGTGTPVYGQANQYGSSAGQTAGQLNQYGNGSGTGTPVYGQANQYGSDGVGAGYGNGTCDGTCTGTPGQSGSGPNWSDADGDGTCDNYGTMQQQNMRGSQGGGMMNGRGNR